MVGAAQVPSQVLRQKEGVWTSSDDIAAILFFSFLLINYVYIYCFDIFLSMGKYYLRVSSLFCLTYIIKDCYMPFACQKVLDEPAEGHILRNGFCVYRYHSRSLLGSMQEYYLEDIG